MNEETAENTPRIDNGGQVYPVAVSGVVNDGSVLAWPYSLPGVSLRAHLAGQFMRDFIKRESTSFAQDAESAVGAADALIAELNKPAVAVPQNPKP